MDKTDREILTLLCGNGRMSVKEIASKVSLTPPAVSQRIHRLENEGIIQGYTAVLDYQKTGYSIRALISTAVPPAQRDSFLQLAESQTCVLQCCHVTGSYSYIMSVATRNMEELEALINRFQKFGQTSTQIILSSTAAMPALF